MQKNQNSKNTFLLSNNEDTQFLKISRNCKRVQLNNGSNKPGTAKVGAISKAQNCKRGDPLGFVKLQLAAKYQKN